MLEHMVITCRFSFAGTEDTLDAPLLIKHASEAVAMFKAMRVRGVVVDLRGNNGGDDQPSADLVSLFYTGRCLLYSVVCSCLLLLASPVCLSPLDDGPTHHPHRPHRPRLSRSDRLPYPYSDIRVGTIKPNADAYAGPVAVLTDHLCVSDCEGVA